MYIYIYIYNLHTLVYIHTGISMGATNWGRRHICMNLSSQPLINRITHEFKYESDDGAPATHCNTLQDTATHCNTLQHPATHCNTLQHPANNGSIQAWVTAQLPQHTATHWNAPQHTATHCNTLHHTATHCNSAQLTAIHCKTPQHTAIHCHTLQRTATHYNTLQHTTIQTTHCNTLEAHNLKRHSAIHCNTLQRTATHCNTVQHTTTHRGTQSEETLCNALQHTTTHCNTLRYFRFGKPNKLNKLNWSVRVTWSGVCSMQCILV